MGGGGGGAPVWELFLEKTSFFLVLPLPFAAVLSQNRRIVKMHLIKILLFNWIWILNFRPLPVFLILFVPPSCFGQIIRCSWSKNTIIENMISPDYVLCYIPWHNGNFGKILKILENFEKFWKFLSILENFGKFWILLDISNYNFQSRRQIMTVRGAYTFIYHSQRQNLPPTLEIMIQFFQNSP